MEMLSKKPTGVLRPVTRWPSLPATCSPPLNTSSRLTLPLCFLFSSVCASPLTSWNLSPQKWSHQSDPQAPSRVPSSKAPRSRQVDTLSLPLALPKHHQLLPSESSYLYAPSLKRDGMTPRLTGILTDKMIQPMVRKTSSLKQTPAPRESPLAVSLVASTR